MKVTKVKQRYICHKVKNLSGISNGGLGAKPRIEVSQTTRDKSSRRMQANGIRNGVASVL